MTELDRIFKECRWEGKFSHVIPDEIDHLFREEEAEKAEELLENLTEEDEQCFRRIYLFSDSLGQCLAIEELEYEPL